MKEITITPNQIKNAIEYLVNENEMLQDKVYKLESIIKEAREYIINQKLHKFEDTTGGLTYEERKLLQILDKENKAIELDMLKALNTDLDDDVEMG